jgi:opacity protein-like surface antigen
MSKKISILFCYIIAAIFIPSLSHATPASWQAIISGRPILAVGAGADITSDLSTAQNFPFNQPIIDTRFQYSPNHTTTTEPVLDVFAGAEWKMTPRWTLQLGLGYNQASPFEVNGSFQQGILPLLSQINYDYRYNIRLRQALVESKWAYLFKDRYRPYFFLGVGTAINTASNYLAYVPFPNLTRQYKNNTEAHFSYSLGAGIDIDLVEKLRLGIGYRFSDVGKVALGAANIFGNEVAGTLSQSHVYVNEVLMQFTFLFC